MSIYDIDFTVEEQKILPPPKRENLSATPVTVNGYNYQPGRIIKSFINACLAPLQDFYSNTVNIFFNTIQRQAMYNGQFIVLHALLNKELEDDETLDIIKLSDSTTIYNSFKIGIYAAFNSSTITTKNTPDACPISLGTNTHTSGYDLVIKYPSSYSSTKANLVKGFAEKNKLYGTKIQYLTY